ncbi:GNAT family N-acetyltransferase [Vallitalea sp.]|jgi:ribosomal-protein-alanine N-acetyltransferase|uniref:GNAT family N-acetyltransferase n=1 Tax=Vallitalea sp. TaxID=1882829 RepID=UPI0025D9F8B2|nr:GNAT family N-acetyltransferase [Vallitalea sp.]MCT4687647.1 GNAT family N-acetyltransferase [Vallitalea sp.]
MKKIYSTNRLVLRTIDTSFTKKVLDYYTHNKDFLKYWEPKREQNFYKPMTHRKTIRREQDLINSLSMLRLWIFKKEDTSFERIIGTLAFSNIVRGCFQSCFLGYKLDKDEVNKGYMSEALKKGIEVIFQDYKLHRIEANIMPRNEASINLVKKLGFTNEGLSKKYLKINDIWENHYHMVLLNEDME